MDWKVYPNSRIAGLPQPLRPPALVARNVARWRRARYVYENDGLATSHYTPFLEDDKEFDDLYWRLEADWFPNWTLDLRWRMWILTRMARQASLLAGNFAEFGSYRGGCAAMILSTCQLPPERRFYLFDTFTGLPEEQLTRRERRRNLGGHYADTSREHVESLLREWREIIEIREGDVFDTLPATETGELSLVHMDLNASAPTEAALEYAYPRMVPGAILVLDDYGGWRFEDQRRVIDEFFSDNPEGVTALPTGQGLVIRGPRG